MQTSLHGYLSAFPFEHFRRLQSLEPVWAPFYVVRAPIIFTLVVLKSL